MKKLFLALFWVIVAVSFTMGQLTQEMVLNLKLSVSPKFSPDGKYISYFKRVPPGEDEKESGSKYELHVIRLSDKKDMLFAGVDSRVRNVQWSHDGSHLYFIKRDSDTKKNQIFKMPVDGGEAISVTSFKKDLVDYAFSPSGKQLAVILREKQYAGQKQPHEDWIINEIRFKYQYLYLVNSESGEITKISPDTMHIWDFQWMPDESGFIVQAGKKGMIDDSYMFRDMFHINLKDTSFVKIVNHDGKMGKMEISPDGKYVVFRGGVDISDPSEGSLLLVNLNDNTRDYINLTEGFEGSVEDFYWKDKNTILFNAEYWNENRLFTVKTDKNQIKPFWNGQVYFTSFDYLASQKKITFSGSNYQTPPEIFIMKGKNLQQLTFSNPELKNISFQPQEDFNWKARDGKTISGLLVKPVDFEEGKTYPLVVMVHGGPEAAYLKTWNNYYSRWPQILAQKGAFVFMPNYRGSTGRGVEFAKADHGDMMGVDFNDILDGIDALIEKGWVDPNKVGITGGSYGGYASAWAATRHSDRFAAAVMFVGISNQVSKIGVTDTWYENALVHWNGWPYDDNFEKAWDRSPLKYIDNAKTPILICHGDRDTRVPTSQSIELYRALKYKNVPVELVIYPGEGHGNRKYKNQKHYMKVSLDWFEQYLLGK
ncbi:MAG: S9 family peptidase [Calditrichia bacterium]